MGNEATKESSGEEGSEHSPDDDRKGPPKVKADDSGERGGTTDADGEMDLNEVEDGKKPPPPGDPVASKEGKDDEEEENSEEMEVAKSGDTKVKNEEGGDTSNEGGKNEHGSVKRDEDDEGLSQGEEDDDGDKKLPPSSSSCDKESSEGTVSHDERWQRAFDDLKRFKDEHGHCEVSTKDNDVLYKWCNAQRKMYYDAISGGGGSMTQTRFFLLNDLGFRWGEKKVPGTKRRGRPSKASIEARKALEPFHPPPPPQLDLTWDEKFDMLRRYKEEHGDCLVPTNSEENRTLSRFVISMRSEYKKYKTGGGGEAGGGILTDERVKALDGIEFVWAAKRGPKLGSTNKVTTPTPSPSAATGKRRGRPLKSSSKRPKKPQLTPYEQKRRDEIAARQVARYMAAEKGGDQVWLAMFEKLKQYKEARGDCDVPAEYEEDLELSYWVMAQRLAYDFIKEGVSSTALTEERVEQMSSLGFSWSLDAKKARKRKRESAAGQDTADKKAEKAAEDGRPPPGKRAEQRWNTMFEQLKLFQKKHGMCDVPRQYRASPGLGEWVKTQRRTYRDRRDGKSSAMSDERAALLEGLGFNWFYDKPREPPTPKSKKRVPEVKDPKKKGRGRPKKVVVEEPSMQALKNDRWNTMYERLRLFRLENGHCHVDKKDKKHEDLYGWCKAQRGRYRRREKDTIPMSQEHIRRLETLGFPWTVSSHRLVLPGEYEFPPEDGYGHVDWEGYVDWNGNPLATLPVGNSASKSQVRGKKWEEMFQQLKEYRDEHGTCQVKRKYNAPLAEWVKTQRRAYRQTLTGRTSAMIQERIDLLESLPEFTWTRSGMKVDNEYNDLAMENDNDECVDDDGAGEGEANKDTNAHRWGYMFRCLKTYKEHHGHCNVPRGYKGHPQLGEWVKTQRKNHKHRLEGKTEAMAEDRIKLLESIGFTWEPGKGKRGRPKKVEEWPDPDGEETDGDWDADENHEADVDDEEGEDGLAIQGSREVADGDSQEAEIREAEQGDDGMKIAAAVGEGSLAEETGEGDLSAGRLHGKEEGNGDLNKQCGEGGKKGMPEGLDNVTGGEGQGGMDVEKSDDCNDVRSPAPETVVDL